jgi:pyruvate/2-oxoglutarate dehydrogenase complex dihydrolipoamide dehydrogenase (E3) component
MHQGMIALMNAMMPGPTKMNFRKFVVPWTVFTEPQFSQVGLTEPQLKERGIAYETITVKYGDYGAAIAEAVDTGFVKVFASTWGRIYGAVIIGEGSGEMINEWALAIQSKTRLHKLMMLQHSFPTMGFLSKRIAETWMMKRMQQSGAMRKMAQMMYRR